MSSKKDKTALNSIPDPDRFPWMDAPAQRIFRQMAGILLMRGELDDEKVPDLATCAQTLVLAEQVIELDQQLVVAGVEVKREREDYAIFLTRLSGRLFKIGILETDMAAIGMKTPEQMISELSN